MRSIAIVPVLASVKRPADLATFRDAAKLWQERHGGDVIPRSDFRGVLNAIEVYKPELLAFFCHGLARSLPQMGATLTNVDQLAAAIAAGCPTPRVELFACLAGEDLVAGPAGPPGGDGGFADRLRDELVMHLVEGGHVDAHGSSSQLQSREKDLGGHTTANPFVRRFPCSPAAPRFIGMGGTWLVGPGDPEWPRWRRWLKHGLGWREFPVLDRAQIIDAVRAIPL